MIDPVNAATGVPPPQATAPTPTPAPSVPGDAATSDRSAAGADGKAPIPRVSMDVQRSQGGVFVYTLRDPATDVVLAVIPRAEVLTPSQGRTFDERV